MQDELKNKKIFILFKFFYIYKNIVALFKYKSLEFHNDIYAQLYMCIL